MSVSGGPDVVDNGLVMYLDTTNLRSFRGEPTTNTISEPFALNGNPGITTGYEASFERVSGSNLPTTAMASISPVWLKFTKTSPTNGRVWFLGTPITYKTGSTDYCYSGYVYTDDTRVTSLTLGTDNVAVSTTQTTLSSWSTGSRDAPDHDRALRGGQAPERGADDADAGRLEAASRLCVDHLHGEGARAGLRECGERGEPRRHHQQQGDAS